MTAEELAELQAYFATLFISHCWEPPKKEQKESAPSDCASETEKEKETREQQKEAERKLRRMQARREEYYGIEDRPVWKGNSDPEHRESYRDQRLLDPTWEFYVGDLFPVLPLMCATGMSTRLQVKH